MLLSELYLKGITNSVVLRIHPCRSKGDERHEQRGHYRLGKKWWWLEVLQR